MTAIRQELGQPIIDLHAHTRESDGTDTPTALVTKAYEAGIEVIAITDHDTMSGWAEAASAAESLPIRLVRGIELSTQHGYNSVHILGLLPDPAHPALQGLLAQNREFRRERLERLVANLSIDFPVSWPQVLAEVAEGATLGRPHVADALVRAGVVESREEAFATMLHAASPYYVPLLAPEPVDGIAVLRAAGGFPVLAHPAGRFRLKHATIAEMVDAGLLGIERNHRENSESGKEWVDNLVAEFGLIPTGGSDYHGTGKPNALGENSTPLSSFEQIEGRATGSPVVGGRSNAGRVAEATT